MFEAFLWGLFATSSLVIGALVVRLRAPGERLLGVIMAFGAGVLISAVAFELIEEAVGISGGSGGTAAGFFVGAAVFTVGDIGISRWGFSDRKDIGGAASDAPPMAIVLGTFLDGVPESAVLGLTLLQSGEIGVTMLVAVFISNLPESIAATSSLRASGWKWNSVMILWSVIAVACALRPRSATPSSTAHRRARSLHVRVRRRRDPGDARRFDDARGLSARPTLGGDRNRVRFRGGVLGEPGSRLTGRAHGLRSRTAEPTRLDRSASQSAERPEPGGRPSRSAACQVLAPRQPVDLAPGDIRRRLRPPRDTAVDRSTM